MSAKGQNRALIKDHMLPKLRPVAGPSKQDFLPHSTPDHVPEQVERDAQSNHCAKAVTPKQPQLCGADQTDTSKYQPRLTPFLRHPKCLQERLEKDGWQKYPEHRRVSRRQADEQRERQQVEKTSATKAIAG